MIEPAPSALADLDRVAMEAALEQARKAGLLGEVPVGAVVVHGGQIVAAAHNETVARSDPTAHAERLALTNAGEALGRWRLDGCTLYSTLEPCPMCAGALVLARISRAVYAAPDPKAGACESLYRLISDPRLNHRLAVSRGPLGETCREILTQFFRERRTRRLIERSCPIPPEGCLSG